MMPGRRTLRRGKGADCGHGRRFRAWLVTLESETFRFLRVEFRRETTEYAEGAPKKRERTEGFLGTRWNAFLPTRTTVNINERQRSAETQLRKGRIVVLH
jgi:hypothetical protein